MRRSLSFVLSLFAACVVFFGMALLQGASAAQPPVAHAGRLDLAGRAASPSDLERAGDNNHSGADPTKAGKGIRPAVQVTPRVPKAQR